MPELPEVENVVILLNKYIRRSKITGVEVAPKGEKLLGSVSPDTLQRELIGREINQIKRIGKYIHFKLTNPNFDLVVHLRMTGKFLFVPGATDNPISMPQLLFREPGTPLIEDPAKQARIKLKLNNGELYFLDTRRFATFHLVSDLKSYPGISKLGPDALSPSLTANILHGRLQRQKPIYTTLLDQTIIAGLGNIYVCEALAQSRIHPLQPANSLSLDQIADLLQHIQIILKRAIAAKGTSFKDFAGVEGKEGNFQQQLLVYGQKRAKIAEQIFPVLKVKIAGRYAHYIKGLQTHIEWILIISAELSRAFNC